MMLKKLNDGIGDIVSFLESALRSFLYSLQSSITFLDVKDKYRIPDMYAHKDLDKETSTRGFDTQLCVGVDYWSSIHIDNDFYYNNLSDNMDDNSILFYFVFPSYRVAVPMRSGDVVCFNPLIYHCCTDPTTHGVKNFSCYVSAKTCNTQIAVTHGNAERL
jgi:ectoine hydroxylase-related dioxygenase (phytanoyl-CoA dioxygenase family)